MPDHRSAMLETNETFALEHFRAQASRHCAQLSIAEVPPALDWKACLLQQNVRVSNSTALQQVLRSTLMKDLQFQYYVG